MGFLRKRQEKKAQESTVGEVLAKEAMDQVRKLAATPEFLQYVGSGGFASSREVEASLFIAVVGDLTGRAAADDDFLVGLTVKHYGFDDAKVRTWVREYKESRR